MLAEAQRQELKELISTGTAPARTLAHARILLKADQGPQGPGWQDAAIGVAVEVSRPTVERVRKRFTQEGLEAACTAVLQSESTRANWMAARKPTSSPWPALPPWKGRAVGRYACCLIGW